MRPYAAGDYIDSAADSVDGRPGSAAVNGPVRSCRCVIHHCWALVLFHASHALHWEANSKSSTARKESKPLHLLGDELLGYPAAQPTVCDVGYGGGRLRRNQLFLLARSHGFMVSGMACRRAA